MRRVLVRLERRLRRGVLLRAELRAVGRLLRGLPSRVRPVERRGGPDARARARAFAICDARSAACSAASCACSAAYDAAAETSKALACSAACSAANDACSAA